MTDNNFNSEVDRAQVYDSFVQLSSGGNRYRWKSLKFIELPFSWPMFTRSTDDGNYFLTPELFDGTVEFDISITSDQVDTANPPTDVKTVSYYMYQKFQRNHVELSISNVFFAKDSTFDSTNKFLRLNATFEVIGMTFRRANDEHDGDVSCVITGKLLLQDHTGAGVAPTFIRQST